MFVTNAPRPKNTVIYSSGKDITFIASTPMVEGQEVVLSADDTVAIRTTASTAFPIGVVRVGTDTAGELVTVDTYFQEIHNGIASGGTLAFGATVKATGATSTDADKLAKYATVSTGFCTAIVLKGGDADELIKVGILASPTKL